MTANLCTIDRYNLLRQKIGEKEAQVLTEYIAADVERKIEAKSEVLATKNDIADTMKDISEVRLEIRETKAEIIKWMIIFWIGQVGITVAIILRFINK